jgi:circadian clock protein KaiC
MSSRTQSAGSPSFASTGISGLDDILRGGFPRNRIYLIQGEPGAGKTTLGLQFLLAGAAAGEQTLYVTLSETSEELLAAARSHGWSLEGVSVKELSPYEPSPIEDENTLFHPAEVELPETIRRLITEVERLSPSRVVVDSLTEIRLLAQTPVRYRRHISALKEFFTGRHCTVLFLDDQSGDLQLQSIANGVLSLEQLAPLYGAERRRVRVLKLRAVPFRGGFHDITIVTGGVRVFPRLEMLDDRAELPSEQIPSGVEALDHLLGGGLDRGTTTLLLGPAGTGKSAIASQYAAAAASRGELAVMYTFEEGLATLFSRSEALGQPLRRLVAEGMLRVRQVNPAELSPGEFISLIRHAVEEDSARLIVIDSLSGYYRAMPEETFLSTQLHELFSYLRVHAVAVITTLAQHGLIGAETEASFDVSYLADTVILLRYFESEATIRKAISVVKKRSGKHETTLRELAMDKSGLKVGEPLRGFVGVMSGSAIYNGTTPMLPQTDAS